jgi:hypothetical protein
MGKLKHETNAGIRKTEGIFELRDEMDAKINSSINKKIKQKL